MTLPVRSDTLRVLMPTPRYYPSMGGVETHVAQVARRLTQVGVDITVLTPDPTGTMPAHECIDGVTVVRVPAWPRQRDWYFSPDIYRIVGKGEWDLIHCQSYHTFVAPMAMLAAQQANIPYVVTFHGGGSSSWFRNTIRQMQWKLLGPLLQRAARLIAIAKFEIALYGQALDLPESRFTLIPNGCDIIDVPIPASDLSHPLIISVGRLERYKGHHRVIEALPMVLEHVPEARVRIVGSGPYEDVLRHLAERLGIASQVEIGSIPPTERRCMAETMASASLVTLLSDYETHPIAALEALALKRPVLVAATSGLAELAERGLVRAIPLKSTPEQVAFAIIDQLRQPLIPPPVELPTWDACAADLLALYRTVVARQLCGS